MLATKPFALGVTLALSLAAMAAASAQNAPAAAAARPALVLLPYEEPGSGDPHAAAITQDLSAEFAQNAIPVKLVSAADHVDAVANARALCESNAAAGLLIAEGRYEQTMKAVHVPFAGSITSFPTHVELRLDQFDCSGKLTWSKVATADESRSGVMFAPANVGSLVDDAFRKAAHDVAALGGAPVPVAPAPAAAVKPGSGTADAAVPAGPYLLVPFEQPGIADPRAVDMTRSLAHAMSERKMVVSVADPLDRLTAVADAAALCARSSAAAIVVPEVRVEQTKRTHGELRLATLGCDGRVLAHGVNTADVGPAAFGHNGGAALVEVTERATSGALDQALSPQPHQNATLLR